jgi:glycosyltransferase involved in cell wall biosynthesis
VFKTHLKENSYDIIVFDNSKSSFRLIDIAHQYSAKVIVIHHNYEYEYDRDNSNILLKYFRLYWIRKCEKEAVNTCDINLTLTWQDVDLLKSHYVKGNDVLFERIGVFEYQHSKYNLCTEQPDGSTKKYFIITGSLHSKQSDKSLLIWLNKYFPILYDMFPNAQLIIAGKSPRKKLKKACSLYKQIQLIDSPTNMQLLLQKANYYLCPVFLGGGLKLRIMDGLKNGLPVLTHTISARGYEDFKKLGCLFDYSDEISFKNALTELLNCDIDKTRISTLYNNQFSFENGIGRLKNIILHLK